jgi:hypothetical protein
MQQIPLQSEPNQQFEISLDDNLYSISLIEAGGIMAASVIKNRVKITENLRCVAGFALIPTAHQEDGNFLFFTRNFELPYYTEFNGTQTLVYFSATELSDLRGYTPPPLTANFFDPVGKIPQRFKPVGYL